MDKPNIQFRVSVLMDSGSHPNPPVHESLSLVSRLAKTYPSLFSAEGCYGDEEMHMGYESSWSGIFTSTRGVIDGNG